LIYLTLNKFSNRSLFRTIRTNTLYCHSGASHQHTWQSQKTHKNPTSA